jgi:endonuclease/exonuclease/phosphatase family metal-dependent hydrolase
MKTPYAGRYAPLVAGIALLAVTLPAGALKVCTYNALNWPSDYAERVDAFRLIMDEIDPDIVVLQEVLSWQGANLFRDDVLNYTVPGEYRRMPFVDGPDTDNACFFKPGVLDSLTYEYLDTDVRYTMVYRFRLDGYASAQAEFTILSTHLKAGTATSDKNDRLAQTTIIRNYLDDYPSGSNFMVSGDFNIQASTEGSYQILIASMADNDGRSKDPINSTGTWHDNYAYSLTHTQSPRVDGGSGSGGGMDDRFDFILVSYALDDGDGLSYAPGSYVPFGNDGLRLNTDINDPTNLIVSAAMADALYDASDHIPVFLELQVPARLNDFGESIVFGDVILGGAAEETLHVSNAASAPADSLDYSMSAPAGFGAPGGTFALAAGEGSDHVITMNTSTPGIMTGDLEVYSNDLDDPTAYVALSGTVLDHANPSLDESSVVLVDTLDFGSLMGGSQAETLSVHNEGYTSLQAILEVYDAEIVGGDGRFTFTGGFVARTADSTPADYVLGFDGDGAAEDSLYVATLTLSTRDDASVAGGSDLSDLSVVLQAYVLGPTGVEDEQVLTLSLGPASPNPFTRRTTLEFSLPRPEHARVEIYDVSGRLVSTVLDRYLSSGVHRVVWDGRDISGAETASGIYFCRAKAGDWHEARKIVLLR